MDLHESTASIREAIEFSALLRQQREISKKEKLEYVDKIIDLLELDDIQDALIMSLGVEQRKRLTIAVELAAKPSLLLFLDEPTSGLDSQSAFSIVRFLRKLSQAGQAIICTIHQPSSVLIQQFDMILALNPGGNTFYFGPVGENGSAITKYFADRGTICPPHKNVAEFILETAAKGGSHNKGGKRLNWNKEWLASEEYQVMTKEIGRLKEERNRVAPAANDKSERAFAAPVWIQTVELTNVYSSLNGEIPHTFTANSSYPSRSASSNGFTFYMLGKLLGVPPTTPLHTLPRLPHPTSYRQRRPPQILYEPRPLGSPASTPPVFTAGSPSAPPKSSPRFPLPLSAASSTGSSGTTQPDFQPDTSTAGYVFLMTMLFFLFQASWGQWICAFAPSFTVISNVLPFFFVMYSLFNGIIRPYSALPVFWKYWMYYINPSTWFIGGVLGAILEGVPVNCPPQETTVFNPPPGQTCSQYADNWVTNIAKLGYLTNPDATSNCGYCQYKDGTEYLATLNISPDDRWRDFGLFLMFVFTNWMLVYFFIYFVRVRGFTFGFGPLFGFLGRAVDKVAGLFNRKEKKFDEEEKP